MNIKEIVKCLENVAPLSLQEAYDNAGLILGRKDENIPSVLVCIDICFSVVEEAIRRGIPMIISHHPLIFQGLKKISGKNEVEKCVIEAIKHDIAIYSIHTNLDNVIHGVNAKIAKKIGLQNIEILAKQKSGLKKLVCFVPSSHADLVRNAIFSAGAGKIGQYDQCSFNIGGLGTFRGSENSNPFAGQKGEIHFEDEIRIETIFPSYLQNTVVSAMIKAHPYEEVAYDIYSLDNSNPCIGAGIVGNLPNAMNEQEFIKHIQSLFHVSVIRHTKLLDQAVRRVALCGGSGSFLLENAKNSGAQFFISADFKYHQFFDAENRIVIADIGHYESEQFTTELIAEILRKDFPTLQIHITEFDTNPILYFK